ncbi:transposase [Methylobacterium sp. 2A]|jgi:transposase|nr:transposase [Methylobacterium sp. 2A]
MPKTRPAYPAEFHRQMVDLVRTGRDPTDLAREFEPSRQTIQNWVAEADRGEGHREAKSPAVHPDLTATERAELVRLRRENRQLKLEREPKVSAAISYLARRSGSRGRPGSCRQGLPVHEREPGRLPDRCHGPCARRVEGWRLSLGQPGTLGAGAGGRRAVEAHPHRASRLA